MKISLLGKKVGMTQVFRKDGTAVPVTVLEVAPSVVTCMKSAETDGYDALQLGYGERKAKHLNKSQKSFFDKMGVGYKKILYETRTPMAIKDVKPGDEIGIDNFEMGDIVDVGGISIGKGFQGAVKRHHFSGGRGSHGDTTGRRTGSIGQSSFPSRVFKGMRGPGRMGNEQVTVQNLEVIEVDIENNLLVVQGAVPGPKNHIVRVSLSLKKGKDKELKVRSASSAEVKPEAPAAETQAKPAQAEVPPAEQKQATAEEEQK